MPSQLHEALLLLFRNDPRLAPELLREALHLELPAYTEARVESAELTDVQPAEYRADLVVLLYEERPVLGIVVEAQLSVDEHKRYAWPVYVVGLRARMRCPVCLLVVTADEGVARWARREIALGGGNTFQAFVLGPSGVPEISDEARAKATPELAILSVMAHGKDADTDKALQIALAAIAATVHLDATRMPLYFDLVLVSLSEAVRKSVEDMKQGKYEYQSDFARKYFSEGEARGRSVALLKLLQLRFGAVSDAVTTRVRSASLEELDLWTERVLSAESVEDVLR